VLPAGASEPRGLRAADKCSANEDCMAAAREDIAVLLPLTVGIATTIVTVVIHALALRTIFQYVRRERTRGVAGVRFWRDVLIVTGVVVVAFAAHLVEIAIWGSVYYRIGEFPDLATAFYQSAVNYTTLGDETVTVSGSWRLLGPIEAADGMLLFGITTATIYAVIHRLLEMRWHLSDS
jgi:hypothetical protein